MNVLVSACLLGTECRYDGRSGLSDSVLALDKSVHLIPICPEQMGGLPTPREPAEICNGKVIDRKGKDITAQFKKGAEETLKLGKLFNCNYAILKARSPSCGCKRIYDGTFSGTLIDGNGITAELLLKNDIKVLTEEETNKLNQQANFTCPE